jgi:ribosomal protein L31
LKHGVVVIQTKAVTIVQLIDELSSTGAEQSWRVDACNACHAVVTAAVRTVHGAQSVQQRPFLAL